MRQATLVAFYGSKPTDLAELIQSCQEYIFQFKKLRFQPYQLSQVHATVIGLERLPGPLPYNRNFFKHRRVLRKMNPSGLCAYLQRTEHWPLDIQIGGFQDRNYPFCSRGQRPYLRSFSIQGNAAVLIGWPVQPLPFGAPQSRLFVERDRYPDSLNELRSSAQVYNVLHAYHASAGDTDNDLYLRLGLIDNARQLDVATRAALQHGLRAYLSEREPVISTLGLNELNVVCYQHDTLPRSSSRCWPLRAPYLTTDRFWSQCPSLT